MNIGTTESLVHNSSWDPTIAALFDERLPQLVPPPHLVNYSDLPLAGTAEYGVPPPHLTSFIDLSFADTAEYGVPPPHLVNYSDLPLTDTAEYGVPPPPMSDYSIPTLTNAYDVASLSVSERPSQDTFFLRPTIQTMV